MKRWTGIVVAGVVGLLAGNVSGAVLAADRREDAYAALDLFARVLTQVGESYVDPISQRDLVYHALDGLDNALDAHSTFLDPDAFRRMREESEGQYVGIGAATREDPKGLRVTSVVRDGPAARAGVLAGDLIVAVNGTPIAGMAVDAATELVRGREGDAVTLGIERDGQTRQVPLLRTRVMERSVDGEIVEPGLAYVRIRQFREGVAATVASTVAELTPRAIVLDLRQNPGGRLDEAVATVDLFLRSGRIVSTRGRRPGGDEVWEARDDKADFDGPVVVLIDGQSASAAEIVAGALEDHDRATLVGERTYGKGSVQSLFEYEDGSALKLTIARYFLPKGESIDDHVGIAPDVQVGPPVGEGPVQRLRARADRLRDEDERAELLALVEQLPAEPPTRAVDFSGPVRERLARDPQLAAAVAEAKKKR
ncbi:MAG: S41 family peptidase [Myxococcota bacterium]